MCTTTNIACPDCMDVLLTSYEITKGRCLSCIVEPYHSRGLPEPMFNYMALLMQRQMAEEVTNWHPSLPEDLEPMDVHWPGHTPLTSAELADVPF